MTNTGWECPRCHRVNAPTVRQCFCSPKSDSLRDRLTRREPRPIVQQPPPTWDCAACRESGICGCYRPDRDAVIC